MTSSHKKILFALVLIGIAIVAGLYAAEPQQADQTPQEEVLDDTENNDDGLTTKIIDEGYSFQYPDMTDTTYVTMTDWPPALQVANTSYECTEAGTPEARAGQTQQKIIGDREFCVTEVAEGAAGSVYHQYAYATEINNATFIYTFAVRMPQCQNYDDVERTACQQEQENFDPDAIADTLVRTTRS